MLARSPGGAFLREWIAERVDEDTGLLADLAGSSGKEARIHMHAGRVSALREVLLVVSERKPQSKPQEER